MNNLQIQALIDEFNFLGRENFYLSSCPAIKDQSEFYKGASMAYYCVAAKFEAFLSDEEIEKFKSKIANNENSESNPRPA